METKALDQILGQLRSAAALAGGAVRKPAAAEAGGAKADFANVLKASLDHVNNAEQEAGRLARDFELGSTEASLPDVMVSLRKANISFQKAVQVRNRLVTAYHDIMNMQV